MAKYLVTGGGGFIGSHMVEELLRRGHNVRVVDNFSTGKRQNLEAALEGARGTTNATDLAESATPELLTGDLADPDVARQAIAGVDFVLHQAAIPSVPRSVADPVTSHRANVDATLNVLMAARDAGVKRRYADAAEARGHAAQSVVAIRAAEAGGRAVHAALHATLRARDGHHPLLQCLWTAPGSLVRVFRCDLGVLARADAGAPAHHLR